MNILMIVSWYTPKGYEKLEAGVFHNEQSIDLEKHGCNVCIYYPFDSNITENETKDMEWGLLTYRSKYTPGKIFATKKQMAKTFDRIIKEFKPDILHAHVGGAAGYYTADFSKKYNIPMIITEHSPLELTHVDKFGIGRILTNKAYKTSKMNCCVSNDAKNKLQSIFPKYPFDVYYNGIILPEYKESENKHYKDGYLNIVIVAVLYDKDIKGLQHLLPAIKQLKDQGELIALHHIGGGEYLDYYKEMAKELDISDEVTFYGRCTRSELYEISNEMDFFCSASMFEASGVSVEEAMLLGKPILGTNSGGVDSLVPDYAGHIVEKGSSDALAEGVLYMKEHLKEFDENQIKEYAMDSFEIGHISEKYIQLYQNVLAEKI